MPSMERHSRDDVSPLQGAVVRHNEPMTHFYRPSEGHRLPHDPFNAIVGPRPIGWIGTLDVEGRRNLAPYSFFNALNYLPPLVGFSSGGTPAPDAHTPDGGRRSTARSHRTAPPPAPGHSAARPSLTGRTRIETAS